MKSARYPQPAGIQPLWHPAGFPRPLFFFQTGLCFITGFYFVCGKVRVYYLSSMVSVRLNKQLFFDRMRQFFFTISSLIPLLLRCIHLLRTLCQAIATEEELIKPHVQACLAHIGDRNANYRVMVTFLRLCRDFLCWHFYGETEGIKNLVS